MEHLRPTGQSQGSKGFSRWLIDSPPYVRKALCLDRAFLFYEDRHYHPDGPTDTEMSCLNNDDIHRYNHGKRCDVRYALQSMETNENGENQESQVILRLSRCRLLYVDQVHLLPVPAS